MNDNLLLGGPDIIIPQSLNEKRLEELEFF